MFASLRARLWLSYALMIVTALGIVATVLLVYLYRNPFLYRQKLERLKAVETVLVEREAGQSGELPSSKLERAAQTFEVRLILFSADGQAISDTETGNTISIPFPHRKLNNRIVPIVRDDKGQSWLYSMRQLPDGNWLLVAVPRPRLTILNIFTDDLLPLFIRGGLIALFLSLVLAYIFARWVADPLQKIIAAAGTMPSPNSPVISVGGPREVQELTAAFNSMIARLQKSQQSQRDFVANVSHELKTPLTSIQGFAQAILDDTAQTAEARQQAAAIIHDEAGRMHRMVLDLLDLARLDSGTADITMAPVDIRALLISVCERFSPQAQKSEVSLGLDIAEQLPSITGDGDRLAQVFSNLVDNALKYTWRGGWVKLSAGSNEDVIHITVSDNGSGISEADLPHLFERFFQVDRSRRGGGEHGTGLGLAIAREIVEAHGGTISVRSQPGMGTSFVVRLPLTQTEKATRTSRRT